MFAERLALEVATARRVEEQLQQQNWATMATRLRTSANSPSYDELTRRRKGSGS